MNFFNLKHVFSYLLKICYGISMYLKNLSLDLSKNHYGSWFYSSFQSVIQL